VLPVFLDTCVLLKPYLCDTVLTVAEGGLCRPLWSTDVLEELKRNLVKRGATEAQVGHRVRRMTEFFPDAEVVDYRQLIAAMTNDPKDRHVVAAAVRGGAELIVTENLKDFRPEDVHPHGIEVAHQDEFLLDLLDLSPGTVLGCLARQVSRYRREPRTVSDLLDVLGSAGHGCPRFAATCREFL